MNVQGQVVSVEQNVSITKQNGGSYQGTRFSYRDATGKLVEQNFHNNSLKFNPKINVALSNMKAGDSFTMVKEKEGEFWNVKDIIIGGTATMETNTSSKPVASPAPKSNYETAEERAKKQVYIIRQSSISSAVALASLLKLKDTKEVLKVAKEFEAYVMDTEFDDGSIHTLKSDDMEIQ